VNDIKIEYTVFRSATVAKYRIWFCVGENMAGDWGLVIGEDTLVDLDRAFSDARAGDMFIEAVDVASQAIAARRAQCAAQSDKSGAAAAAARRKRARDKAVSDSLDAFLK
jgi:hypothetical protein